MVMAEVVPIKKHQKGKTPKKQEEVVMPIEADVAYADDYVPDSKGKIVVIDYYKKSNAKGIKNASKAIIEAGYTPEVLKHSKAKKLIKQGVDFSDIYQGAFLSGSGRSWSKTEEKSDSGKQYLKYNAPVAEHFVGGTKRKIPLYTVCHGAYTAHVALNKEKHKIVNTGKMHRDDQEGYYHQFGMDAEHLDDKIKNPETFNHAGEKLIKRYEQGHVRVSQIHSERTDKKDIKYFFDKHVKAKGPQATDDYSQPVQYQQTSNY